MKHVLVLSGKGGTGQTSITAALIALAEAEAFADCDVDAPNLHRLVRSDDAAQREVFFGLDQAVIDSRICVQCGLCLEHCRFGAIECNDQYSVDPFRCEGCGVCAWVCSTEAISMQDHSIGWLQLHRRPALFSSAVLTMGSGNSGLLVSEVKKRMNKEAVKECPDAPIAFIDGSPGIGCPVLASITGCDIVLLVAEPSVAGMSDLKRVMRVALGLQADVVVCVNQADSSPGHTGEIEKLCEQQGIPFLGQIPYDPLVVALLNENKTMVSHPCAAGEAVRDIFQALMQYIERVEEAKQ